MTKWSFSVPKCARHLLITCLLRGAFPLQYLVVCSSYIHNHDLRCKAVWINLFSIRKIWDLSFSLFWRGWHWNFAYSLLQNYSYCRISYTSEIFSSFPSEIVSKDVYSLLNFHGWTQSISVRRWRVRRVLGWQCELTAELCSRTTGYSQGRRMTGNFTKVAIKGREYRTRVRKAEFHSDELWQWDIVIIAVCFAWNPL